MWEGFRVRKPRIVDLAGEQKEMRTTFGLSSSVVSLPQLDIQL
jgi:hypothetical protein